MQHRSTVSQVGVRVMGRTMLVFLLAAAIVGDAHGQVEGALLLAFCPYFVSISSYWLHRYKCAERVALHVYRCIYRRESDSRKDVTGYSNCTRPATFY